MQVGDILRKKTARVETVRMNETVGIAAQLMPANNSRALVARGVGPVLLIVPLSRRGECPAPRPTPPGRFEHNVPEPLVAALTRHKGKRHLVIVEGIYSMDGDFGNLNELMDVADAHEASVFVDEAHSMLACGANGRGAVEHFGVDKRIRILYGTFSKAFGALGGFVCGSKETLDYLRFYSHPYVYSCALPPVVVAAILKALEIGMSRSELRSRLWENADHFHKGLTGLGIDTGSSTTYIMPLVVGDRERMYRLGHELRHRGLWVAPVDYPAVPQDKICFRACVTANHTRADLDEALNILSDTLVPAHLSQTQGAP